MRRSYGNLGNGRTSILKAAVLFRRFNPRKRHEEKKNVLGFVPSCLRGKIGGTAIHLKNTLLRTASRTQKTYPSPQRKRQKPIPVEYQNPAAIRAKQQIAFLVQVNDFDGVAVEAVLLGKIGQGGAVPTPNAGIDGAKPNIPVFVFCNRINARHGPRVGHNRDARSFQKFGIAQAFFCGQIGQGFAVESEDASAIVPQTTYSPHCLRRGQALPGRPKPNSVNHVNDFPS